MGNTLQGQQEVDLTAGGSSGPVQASFGNRKILSHATTLRKMLKVPADANEGLKIHENVVDFVKETPMSSEAWKNVLKVRRVHNWKPRTNIGYRSLENATMTATLDQFLYRLKPDFGNLRCLKFSFPNLARDSGNLTELKFKRLGTFIGHALPNLRHLKIEYPNDNLEVTNDGLKAFGKYLHKNLKNLESLEFIGMDLRMSQINHKGLIGLIENLVNLKHLKLILPGSNHLTDEDLEALGSAIAKKLPSLVSLSLNFNRCTNITDKSIESLLHSVESGLTHLEKLHLEFRWCHKIVGKGLKITTEMKNMKDLSLNLSKTILNNKGLELLGSGITSYLPNLRRIQLNLGECINIHFNTFRALESKIIQNMPNLEKIDLNFDSCSITKKGEIIGSELAKNYSRLQQLTYHLDGADEITLETLEKLFSSINTNLTSLKQLRLYLSKCSTIINQDPEIFGNKLLSNLKGLEQLILSFDRCDEVEDTNLEKLGTVLASHMSGLKQFEFRFSNNAKITNKGVESFCTQVVSQGKQLEKLALDFSYCLELRDDFLSGLVDSIMNSHQLKIRSLSLSFWMCRNISDENRKALETKLASVPDLEALIR